MAEPTDLEGRRKRTLRFQRYVLNPPYKLLVHMGLVRDHMLVETRGRKTGKRRRTVVGCVRDGDVVWVVAEQGRHAGYVRNLEADPHVRLRLGRRWLPARATVVDADDPEQRLNLFSDQHAALVRKFGLSLLTVRFDLDR